MGLLRVIKNEPIASGVFGLEIAATPELMSAAPGSFVHIAVGSGVFLRRPFGLHDTDAGRETVTVAYAVRGKGTKELSRACSGTELDVLGPLGKGFSLPEGSEHILLIGGGMGAAPLLHAAQSVKGRASCDIALGFASAGAAFSLDRFAQYGKTLRVATEDGSLGTPGNVGDMIGPMIKRRRLDAVWACGPAGMYRALKQMECLRGIACQVSLEERMGCGVGACLTCSCRIKTKTGYEYRRVCADGPVFTLDEVVLDGE